MPYAQIFSGDRGSCGSTSQQGYHDYGSFFFTQEEHFKKLLPKLRVGQYAILLKFWDQNNACASEVSPEYILWNS